VFIEKPQMLNKPPKKGMNLETWQVDMHSHLIDPAFGVPCAPLRGEIVSIGS
jgi:hypothetical protein